jgi:hypothetical protein
MQGFKVSKFEVSRFEGKGKINVKVNCPTQANRWLEWATRGALVAFASRRCV